MPRLELPVPLYSLDLNILIGLVPLKLANGFPETVFGIPDLPIWYLNPSSRIPAL